ncbi:hypothetical protein QE152_g35739 [Popillia japonica]|uniref:Adhesive plaque matrix protein-like n=1 Tax=Popillia japonica TaxID=7064 RepID=A0AAW1IF09_POPJA
MVYETDFYTTRRPYRVTPSITTYSVSTPRYYTVRDAPDTSRRAAEQQYSYSYQSSTESRGADPYSRPTTRSYTSTERVSRSSDAGPGSYSYNTERSSRSYGDGPGGYQSSYSSTTSGRLPGGLGKVHVVHTYDRIVPYVGHKRLTVVTSNPMVYKVRPSILNREFDRIEHKYRPNTYTSALSEYLNSQPAVRYYVRYPYTYSYTPSYYYTLYRPYYPTYYTNRYLINRPSYYDPLYYPYYYYYNYPLYRPRYSSLYPLRSYLRSLYPSYYNYYYNYYPFYDPKYWYLYSTFDDETRLIKAETASLLRRIHSPIPRTPRALPLPYINRYDEYPTRSVSDKYIYRMLVSSQKDPKVIAYTTYYTEPVKKYFGQHGQLSCVSFAGDKCYPRRRNVYVYEDPVRNDIQLLSYYIAKFRQERPAVSIKELPSDEKVETIAKVEEQQQPAKSE